MHMDVPPEILFPGMQHQRESRHAAQMARAPGKLGQRRRGSGEQVLVEPARCRGDQTIEIVRQGVIDRRYGATDDRRNGASLKR